MTTATRRIRIRAVAPVFGSTSRVICDDGETFTIDMAGATRGRVGDLEDHITPGGEARIWSDAARRITGVGHPRARIHPVTLAIAQVMGTSRDEITAWASSPLIWRRKGEKLLEAPPASGLVQSGDGEALLACACADYAFHQDAFTIHRRIPETLLAACAGRMMRDIVSIPELDPLGIRIIEAQDTPLGTEIVVVPQDGHLEF